MDLSFMLARFGSFDAGFNSTGSLFFSGAVWHAGSFGFFGAVEKVDFLSMVERSTVMARSTLKVLSVLLARSHSMVLW
jgi:hypothetical protein